MIYFTKWRSYGSLAKLSTTDNSNPSLQPVASRKCFQLDDLSNRLVTFQVNEAWGFFISSYILLLWTILDVPAAGCLQHQIHKLLFSIKKYISAYQMLLRIQFVIDKMNEQLETIFLLWHIFFLLNVLHYRKKMSFPGLHL